MPVLQQCDPAREAKVGVAPLMNLIGQGHENRQGEDVAVPGIGRRQGLWKTERQTDLNRKKERKVELIE